MDEQHSSEEAMQDAASPASAANASPASPLTDLETLQAQCQEYLAGWRRAQADYANLQRERERDRIDTMKYANTQLLQSLLPALDQFGLALRFLPSTEGLPPIEQKTWNSWLIGIKAVQTLWEQAATGAGLERIPTTGAFDPSIHEADSQEVDPELTPGNIKRVLQDGWRLHGKVLRPAQVVLVQEESSGHKNE